MMFNGQRANVVINRTRSYVSSVTANVAEGAVGVQPIVAAIASGTVLDVEGTISADRKYVTLTVRTSLAQEPAFEPLRSAAPAVTRRASSSCCPTRRFVESTRPFPCRMAAPSCSAV